jgi:predicted nucleotidyltransferase
VPTIQIDLPMADIEVFCRKWKIRELALFGSVLRADFSPESDIDVLVTFDASAEWSLWDFIEAREELQSLLGRKVDFVEKKCVTNPFRRHSILSTKQTIYTSPAA